MELESKLSAVSYRADPQVLEYLKSLESITCPHVLKPAEWQLSANSESVYVIWPDRRESFFLSNIWKGMRPRKSARRNWARQFITGASNLDPKFAKFFLDLSPRIDGDGDLYLDTDFGVQKYFQHLRPTKEREGLPWSFLSTSGQNRNVVPVIWTGYHVYTILTNGLPPLSEKFRLHLASVAPGATQSPFGPFPPFQKAQEWDGELNQALEELLSLESAARFADRQQACQRLLGVLEANS